MTIEQTRQLGIEFERRLQTMFPAAKTVAKIDTEDLYSFLNQYQLQYIQQLYLTEDQAPSNARPSILIQDVLRMFTKHTKLTNGLKDESLDSDNKVFNLPADYYQYIRSTSHVYGTYKNYVGGKEVANKLVKQSDMHKVVENYFDDKRIIRNPFVILEGNTIKVIYDQYTTLDSLDLVYLRIPSYFSILTNTPCELPYECFESLVSGSLDLYIRHLQATKPKEQKQQKEERDES